MPYGSGARFQHGLVALRRERFDGDGLPVGQDEGGLECADGSTGAEELNDDEEKYH